VRVGRTTIGGGHPIAVQSMCATRTSDVEATVRQILDLEREAFLSLCGRRETQQRMQHMLKTGKALRN